MSEENEKEFVLTQPIKYAHKGEEVEGEFIRLFAPRGKDMGYCSQLKQAFFRALPKDVDKQEIEELKELRKQGEKDEDLDGDAIMTLIAMSQDVELDKVLVTAQQLFRSGIAMIDGEEKLTEPLIKQMSLDDLESMTGFYMANFILASSLTKMKNL